MHDFFQSVRTRLGEWVSAMPLDDLLRALVILVLGWILSGIAARAVSRLLRGRPQPHRVIARRVTFFALMGIVVATVMHQVGFELGPLFGAAGILTVAVGFASQTSASNLISGLFLLTEQSFEVGDAITVNQFTGEVVSIDLLSTKLRTFDNMMVRIPNETMIKTEVVVLTKYPIRRMDLELPIAADADLASVEAEFLGLIKRHPLVFDEPEPYVAVLGYTDSAATVRFAAWTQQELFFQVRSELYRDLQESLRCQGVGLALPRRRLMSYEEASGAPPNGAPALETQESPQQGLEVPDGSSRS